MKWMLYIFVNQFGAIETRFKSVPLEYNSDLDHLLLARFPVGKKMIEELESQGFSFSNWHVVRKELDPNI